MMIDGKWAKSWDPVQKKDEKGRFVRQTSSFRSWITADGQSGPTGSGGFKAEKDRYHLYVGLICPWASRTLAVRKLKGLEDYLTVSVVSPVMTEQGWSFTEFPDATGDDLHASNHLHELYSLADPQYTGRATVPILWDKTLNTIVNNESADIIRMLNSAFNGLVPETENLYPVDLADEIDAFNARTYESYNNGVYRCGFASSQDAYDEALHILFEEMERLEEQLSDGRAFLFGDRITESDIRIFVTSIRFDAAYHGLFKTNRKALKDFPFLHGHMLRVLETGAISDSVNLDHIRHGYYSLKQLNPLGIVPSGPDYLNERVLAAQLASARKKG